jgi:hypothetical protein
MYRSARLASSSSDIGLCLLFRQDVEESREPVKSVYIHGISKGESNKIRNGRNGSDMFRVQPLIVTHYRGS